MEAVIKIWSPPPDPEFPSSFTFLIRNLRLGKKILKACCEDEEN